jgi:AP2-associated kinase
MGNLCCTGGGSLASIEVGKYTVREKERLGEGGFSFVNACVDVNVENKKYALKKMVCTDSESLDAAETEAKVMRAIGHHDNIVSLLDTAFVTGKNGAKDVFLLLECVAPNALAAEFSHLIHVRYCPIALQTLMNKRSLDDREILDVTAAPIPHPTALAPKFDRRLLLFFPSLFLQILTSTCDALVHLHSQTPPIAHRDIKVQQRAPPQLPPTTSSCPLLQR